MTWMLDDDELERRYETNRLPAILASLRGLAEDREVRPTIAEIGRSAIRSFEKLDHLLTRSLGPEQWNIHELMREEPFLRSHENRYIRKPKVKLEFRFDTFPARRGNLELCASSVEGYELDFTGAGLQEVKLLRVDCLEDYIDELLRDEAPEGGRHLDKVLGLFEYVARRASSVCDVVLGDRPRLKWAENRRLISFEMIGPENIATEHETERLTAELARKAAVEKKEAEAALEKDKEAEAALIFRAAFEEKAGISTATIVSYMDAFKKHNRAYLAVVVQMLMDSKGLGPIGAQSHFMDDLKKASRSVPYAETFSEEITAEELDKMCITSFGTTKGFQKRCVTPEFRGRLNTGHGNDMAP